MKRDDEKFFGIVFADIMISFAAFLFVLFIVVAIQPKAKKDGDIAMEGRLCAELIWDSNRDIDLDLWGKSPIDKKATGYANMHNEGMDLFKDVIGFRFNPEHINMEIMCANKIHPGEWIFNVHYYANNEELATIDKSVKATVYIKFNRNVNFDRTLVAEIVLLPNQEKTLFRFVVDGEGNILTDTVNSQQIYIRGK